MTTPDAGTLGEYFSENENLGAGTLPSDSEPVVLTDETKAERVD